MTAMPLLDRYIGRNVAISTLVVMSVLLALFTFFAFTDEASRIGKGNYGVFEAFQYALLTAPRLAYQLLPVGVLLGTTIGLGIMASNSELVVIRASGVSLLRIVFSVMKVGLLFVVITVILGEFIAPRAELYAQTLRSVATSNKLAMQGKDGLWARDGNRFINVRDILPGDRLGQIFIYERDNSYRLQRLLRARTAIYRNGQWILRDVVSSEIGDERVISQTFAEMPWQTQLSPDLLNVVTVKANTLSVWGLYQYVRYLRENGLDSAVYEQTLWGKLMAPPVTAVMVFLAIPFVFGPLRSVGVGHRVMVGALVGIGFHIINQMLAYMGIVFGLNAVLSAILPVVLAFGAGYLLLRRVA